MKWLNKSFFGIGTFILFLGLSTPFINSPTFEKYISNFVNDKREYNVSNYKELEQAVYNSSQAKDAQINLDADINLADFKGTPNYNYNTSFVLNGKGHKFYNKPKEFYLDPIFIETFSDTMSENKIRIQNVVLDDAPVMVGNIIQYSKIDYNQGQNVDPETELNQAIFNENAIFINNITIKNINFMNQTFKYKNTGKDSLGFLANNIELHEGGDAFNDNGLYIGNILVENNVIGNNEIYIVDPIPYRSFSLLTNISYFVCYDEEHHHRGYIMFENIIITNNRIYNNYLSWPNSNYNSNGISVAFGNISGEISGLNNWIGSDGNYLSIKNICIGENLYEGFKLSNSMNSNLKLNNSYAELINQKTNSPAGTQKTKILDFENVIILNNLVFSDFDDQDYTNSTLVDQNKMTAINMEDSGTNNWNDNASSSMLFIGPNYDSTKTLNVMGYESETLDLFNNVVYGRFIEKNSSIYTNLETKMEKAFGIYGFMLKTMEIPLDDGGSKYILTNIIFSEANATNLIQWTPQYDSKSGKLEGAELKFKFVLGDTFTFNDGVMVIKPIYEPYSISDPKLFEDENQISIYEGDPIIQTTKSPDNYIYTIDFKLTKTKNIDIDNIIIKFNYQDNATKTTYSFVAPISSFDIKNGFIKNPNEVKNPGAKIASITFISIIILILLILLIILLIYLLKKYKVAKEEEFQDGYYEFVSETEKLNYENNTYEPYNFDQQFDYPQEDYDFNYPTTEFEQWD